MENRLRLNTTVESVRFLGTQALAFRASDSSHKEQMGIVLRFVDCKGFVREQFFGIVNVADTKAQTLKDEIVNFVGGSTKRSTELKLTREAEIEELLDAGLVETGKGANQTLCLQRPGTTRWGSHFKSVNSLIELFSSTKLVVENLKDNGHTRQICGEAEGIYLSMTSFEFVFVLHFLNKVMGITDFLCQKFQKKSADIVSALNHISTTKMLLQNFRDNGWENFLETVISFCETHEIDVPDMSAPQRVGTGRSCQQNDDITIEHHYHFDIFNVVIDKQMKELDDRFPEQSKELLTLTAALDPQDDFRCFKKDDICSLAEKFYPQDFTSAELHALDLQLTFYAEDIHSRPELQNITSLSELCVKLVETRLAEDYHLIHRLLCLVLTLPVSTASTERAFSALRIIKNRLRSKIEEEFLDDCMLVHIERQFADSIDNESSIDEFATKPRRVQLKIR
ncbi:PREDICTED: uncharacterized protein LOC101302260 [Fragaria vesca subsp. vesca]